MLNGNLKWPNRIIKLARRELRKGIDKDGGRKRDEEARPRKKATKTRRRSQAKKKSDTKENDPKKTAKEKVTRKTTQKNGPTEGKSTNKTGKENCPLKPKNPKPRTKQKNKPTPPYTYYKFVLVGSCNASILALKFASPSVVVEKETPSLPPALASALPQAHARHPNHLPA